MKIKTCANILISAFLMLTLRGCSDGNYLNVEITGHIKDASNRAPIENADVLIKCWVYSTGNWESHTVEQTVKTDAEGFFKAQFEKGEAVDFVIRARGYKKKEEARTLKRNRENIEVYLNAE